MFYSEREGDNGRLNVPLPIPSSSLSNPYFIIIINIITLTNVLSITYIICRTHNNVANERLVKTYHINHLIINHLDGTKVIFDDNATVVIFEDNCTIIPDNQ